MVMFHPMDEIEIQPSKPYAEAVDHEEFKQLRAEVAGKKAATAAEPAEKTPQSEEDKPAPIAAEAGTAETKVQEPPAEKSVDDQIKELRAKGKHAQANKLMVESAVKADREENARLKQQLETLRSRPPERPAQTQQPSAQPALDTSDPAPLATDAKYAGPHGYEEYLTDKAMHRYRAEERARDTRDGQRAIGEAIGRKVQAAKTKFADFETVTAGSWDEASKTGTGLWLTPSMIQFVRESDDAMDVLYHLGKNMTEHARIVALSPAMQLANLGQIAHLIRTPAVNAGIPEKRKPAVTKAAPPPTTLGGADEPEPQSLAEAGSYEQFKAMRKARGRSPR